MTCVHYWPYFQPCDKLREIAKLLGDKSTDVDEAIRAFILAGKTQISEAIEFVKEYLMKIADGFKCTDVISDKVSFLDV